MTARNQAARLIEEVRARHDDVTHDLGAVVRTALYYDPDVTADDILEFLDLDRRRAHKEVDPAIACACGFHSRGGRGHWSGRGFRRHGMSCPARVRVPDGRLPPRPVPCPPYERLPKVDDLALAAAEVIEAYDEASPEDLGARIERLREVLGVGDGGPARAESAGRKP